MTENIIIKQGDGNTRNIGVYNDENNTFISIRKYSRHFMRKYNGWGLDKEILMRMVDKNAKVAIIDTEKKQKYEVYAKQFAEKGIEDKFLEHRPQVFLNLNDFDYVTKLL